MTQTNILATLGPASVKEDVLTQMIIKGMDVVRINFSHGSYEDHDKTFVMLEKVSTKLAKKIKILCDLQGPKIRLGKFSNGQAQLQEGNKFILTINSILGDENKASVDYTGIIEDVEVGKRILINDGAIVLKISGINKEEIETIIEVGGIISDHKGVNLPGMKVSLPTFTEKDIRDINYLAQKPVDYLACSFVRKHEHILEVRERIKNIGFISDPQIIAKIETLEGVANMHDIVKVTDGIMIARGDMAVEMPYEKIPLVQKVLIKLCNQHNKFVITATQMLESMIKSPSPTRAEITDVANAIIDGSNAVMLSGETAMGKYPIETIETMRKIVLRTEKALEDGKIEFADIFN